MEGAIVAGVLNLAGDVAVSVVGTAASHFVVTRFKAWRAARQLPPMGPVRG